MHYPLRKIKQADENEDSSTKIENFQLDDFLRFDFSTIIGTINRKKH